MKKDPQESPSVREIQLHWVVDDNVAVGWLHTHGLAELGLPELEVRDCPAFLGEPAGEILVGIRDYMRDCEAVIKAGQTMQLANNAIVRFIAPEPIPGQESHYEVERLQVVGIRPPWGRCCNCRGNAACEKQESDDAAAETD